MRPRALAGFLWLLCVVLQSLPIWADATEDYNTLTAQFDRQLKAGQYAEAKATAARLRTLAEGPLRSDAWAIVSVVSRQGRLSFRLAEYPDAERLLKWALERCEAL